MTKQEYIATCIADAISALDVDGLPQSIQIGGDFIYPRVALERIRNIKRADTLFPDCTSEGLAR